eukprot:GFUD01000618.1.p1 GENE.GFUD01000618.1~~GFUD01000618.1.p1  ORF type:complete len:178 (+),score=49.51 GFUD01000618.1:51-584(+)
MSCSCSMKAILMAVVVMLMLVLPSMQRRTTRNWWRHTARKPSYMAKYTYHHYHPKLTEELVSERHNTSIHFYSRQRGARIVKSSHFRKMFELGRKISLVCVAQGKPRPNITWLKDGIELNSFSEHEHVFEWKIGSQKIKSKVEIDPAMQRDAGYYECQAYNKHAVETKGFLAKYEVN